MHTQRSPDGVQKAYAQPALLNPGLSEIIANGDAYFEHWQAYLATVNNKQVRTLAEERRPELKHSFEQVHLAARQIHEVFRPFLSDLQKLRAVLEADPTLARIDAQKSLILAAKDKGRQVQQGLDRFLAEMNSVAALLRPPAMPSNTDRPTA